MDVDELMKDVKAEASFAQEWVLYDDAFLKHIEGNWAEVVENLTRVEGYPTVVIYEKLEKIDEYKGESFKIKPDDLDRIVKETI